MKRKFLAIITLALILVLTMAFIACTDYKQEEPADETEKTTVTFSQIVKNGTFRESTASDKNNAGIYNSIPSWTVNSAGLTAPSGGKDAQSGVFASVVDLEETTIDDVLDTYQITTEEKTSAEQTDVNKLETPIVFTKPAVDAATPLTDKRDENGNVIEGEGAEKVKQDTKALLFASTVTSGSIYAKSASITLAADSVYKFQFSVNSKIEQIEGEERSGAFVFIHGAIEKEYKAIDTANTWKTETLYIETAKNSSMEITIELWLGYGPVKSTADTYKNDGNDKYATRGFAMFDNVILTKLVKDVEDEQTEASFGSVYENYDRNLSLHENFLAFNDENKYSAYYVVNGDLASRQHIESTDYFSASNSGRKYFYEFRDYNTSNLPSSYWESVINSSTSQYGIVNPSILYYRDKNNAWTLNYTQSDMTSNFMSGDVWNDTVMTDAYKAYSAAEPYALMFYNKELTANALKTKSTNGLTIDSNKYYKISVWAYVWANELAGDKSYNGTGSILPAYSKTRPTAVDPLGANSTYSYTQRTVYTLYKNAAEEGSASPFALEAVRYFDGLTAAETEEIADFDYTTYLKNFKEKTDAENKLYYTDVLEKVKNWLVTKFEMTLSDSTEDADALAQSFLFTYLYYSYLGNTDVVPTVVYDQNKLTVEMGMDGAKIRQAYLKERSQNLETKKTMVSAQTKYEEDKVKVSDYEKDLATYVSECEAWLTANNNMPKATLRLSGAGKNIDTRTTRTGAWEELTLYVRGNQLSERTVTIELIFGETDENVNKMIGGVFFDNVVVTELTEQADIDAVDAADWKVLSEITATSEVSFGGLVVAKDAEAPVAETLGWKAELASEDVAPADVQKVSVSVVKDAVDLQEIKIGNTEVYDACKLVYKHSEPTASVLTYGKDGVGNLVAIKPNKYYRFAFQIKTVDLEKGVDIVLLKKTDKDFSDFNTEVSDYTSEDWSEVVYYVQGAKSDVYYLTVEISLGSGTRFDTSSYEKGEVQLASFNCLEITSAEYTAAATGDKKQKGLTLDDSSYDIDSGKVSNASYSKVDYTKTSYDDFDEESGKLKDEAIVPVESWTAGDVYGNAFATPTLTIAPGSSTISWKQVKANLNNDTTVVSGKYEIWAKYTDEKQNERKVLLAIKESDSETVNFDLSTLVGYNNWCITNVYVRAVSDTSVSDFSSTVTVGKKTGTTVPSAGEGLEATSLECGAVKAEVAGIAGYEHKFAYQYVYAIESDYLAATSVQSNTLSSLDAGSFYKISVWVKTVGDNAFAGLILGGSNGSLEAKLTGDGVAGYGKIVTGGDWKQYCFYIKTGNFTVSPTVNFCFGNPYAQGTKLDNADSKLFFDAADLSVGKVYFDSVRVEKVTEEQYEVAVTRENEAAAGSYGKLNNETDKLIEKNSDTFVYTLHFTVDSFDSWTKPTTTTDVGKKGNQPNNYKQGSGDNVPSSGTDVMTYGIYNASSADSDMQSALTYLYGNNTSKDLNKVFPFAADYTDAQWKEFLDQFLTLTSSDTGKSGGNNVLVMSNKLVTGSAQHYNLSDTYKYSFASGGYYKLTFTASSLVARPVMNKVENMPDADKTAWATAKTKYYVLGTNGFFSVATGDYSAETTYYTVSYNYDDAYAQFRFISNDSNANTTDSAIKIDTTAKIYIGAYDAEDATLGGLTEKTYTLYVYNPSKSAVSASWSFYLGDTAEKNENKYYDELLVGMVAIDLISVESIDEGAYLSGTAVNYDADGKVIDEKGSVIRYVYAKEATEEEETPGKEDTTPEKEEKEDFWTKLVKDQYFWLYISSFVLGVVIIVVVIVVIVRRFRERHPRKVRGVNKVNTEKDAQQQLKEEEEAEGSEELVSDEFTDDISVVKPVVKQRVVPKKNKKKKK